MTSSFVGFSPVANAIMASACGLFGATVVYSREEDQCVFECTKGLREPMLRLDCDIAKEFVKTLIPALTSILTLPVCSSSDARDIFDCSSDPHSKRPICLGTWMNQLFPSQVNYFPKSFTSCIYLYPISHCLIFLLTLVLF